MLQPRMEGCVFLELHLNAFHVGIFRLQLEVSFLN